MTTYWELKSRTLQAGEKYLNFDLSHGDSRYPVRARKADDAVEILVGESFDNWEEDTVSRKRLTSGWDRSILIDEEYGDIWDLAGEYGEVLPDYENEVLSLVEEHEEPLKAVSTALD